MSASKFPNEQNAKLVDENGLPIDATNPLDTTLKGTDNKVKLVDNTGADVSSTNGLNVVLNNSVKFDYSQNKVKITDEAGNAYSSTNGLPVTGTFWQTTQPISGTVTANINASQNTVKIATTDNTVKIDGTTNTVKIDQATAGANHFELRDATNASHVAKVDSNGSVNTKVTNDTAGAIPIKITDGVDTAEVIDIGGTKYLNVALPNGANPAFPTYVSAAVTSMPTTTVTGSVNIGNTVAVTPSGNVSVVNAASNSLNIKTTGADTVAVTGTVTTNISQTGTNNNVKLTDGTSTVGVTDVFSTKALNVYALNGQSPLNPMYVTTVNNDPNVLQQVRISGTTWIPQRVADRYQQTEWNGLTNGSGVTIYTAQLGIYKIRPTQIMISVSNGGIYAFVFDNGSGTTSLFLKTRLTAGVPHTLTFSNGVLSPYTGGSVRMFNNTGGNSDINTLVQGWEE